MPPCYSCHSDEDWHLPAFNVLVSREYRLRGERWTPFLYKPLWSVLTHRCWHCCSIPFLGSHITANVKRGGLQVAPAGSAIKVCLFLFLHRNLAQSLNMWCLHSSLTWTGRHLLLVNRASSIQSSALSPFLTFPLQCGSGQKNLYSPRISGPGGGTRTSLSEIGFRNWHHLPLNEMTHLYLRNQLKSRTFGRTKCHRRLASRLRWYTKFRMVVAQ